MSGYNAEVTAQENEPNDALVAQRLWEKLKKAENNARLMAELLIEVANAEADMASVSGTMFEALADVHDVFIDELPGIAHDARVARKNMRQTEWGDDLGYLHEWDLELDEDWRG
jgi:hypothetical protein